MGGNAQGAYGSSVLDSFVAGSAERGWTSSQPLGSAGAVMVTSTSAAPMSNSYNINEFASHK